MVTTLAGTVGIMGSADGMGDTAQFSQPAGKKLNQTKVEGGVICFTQRKAWLT
jgi:hypothetical protein